MAGRPPPTTMGDFLPAHLQGPKEEQRWPAQAIGGGASSSRQQLQGGGGAEQQQQRPRGCRCEGESDLCWRYPQNPNAACRATWDKVLQPFSFKGREWTIVELRALWPHTVSALSQHLAEGRQNATLRQEIADDLQVLVDIITHSCATRPRPPRAGMKTLVVQGRIIAEAIAQDTLFQLEPNELLQRPDKDLVDLINRLRELHPRSLLSPALHVLRQLGNVAVHLDRDSQRLTDSEIGDAACVACRFVVLVVDCYKQLCAALHQHDEAQDALAQPLMEAAIEPIPAPNVLLRPRADPHQQQQQQPALAAGAPTPPRSLSPPIGLASEPGAGVNGGSGNGGGAWPRSGRGWWPAWQASADDLQQPQREQQQLQHAAAAAAAAAVTAPSPSPPRRPSPPRAPKVLLRARDTAVAAAAAPAGPSSSADDAAEDNPQALVQSLSSLLTPPGSAARGAHPWGGPVPIPISLHPAQQDAPPAADVVQPPGPLQPMPWPGPGSGYNPLGLPAEPPAWLAEQHQQRQPPPGLLGPSPVMVAAPYGHGLPTALFGPPPGFAPAAAAPANGWDPPAPHGGAPPGRTHGPMSSSAAPPQSRAGSAPPSGHAPGSKGGGDGSVRTSSPAAGPAAAAAPVMTAGEASKRLLQLCVAPAAPPQSKVQQLLQAGANALAVDKSGMTPLHLSCYWAHREAAGLLLRHCPAAAGVVDREGRSPMWVAAQRGHAEVVGMLLAAGADVRQANASGVTPLRVAAALGHTDAVAKLLAAGARPDDADKDGFTPLYVACARSHLEVVQLLLGARAGVDLADKHGRTALWAALHPGSSSKQADASPERRSAVVRALLAAGADVHLLEDPKDREACWTQLAQSLAEE